MAMTTYNNTCLISLVSSSTFALLIIALLFIVSPSYCLNKLHPPDDFRGLMMEEIKTRLGSTPPSCHNKCNQCHPCMAVQVPTMPPSHVRPSALEEYYYLDSSLQPNNRYSNYKPLGWKCRCGGHFYNP